MLADSNMILVTPEEQLWREPSLIVISMLTIMTESYGTRANRGNLDMLIMWMHVH